MPRQPVPFLTQIGYLVTVVKPACPDGVIPDKKCAVGFLHHGVQIRRGGKIRRCPFIIMLQDDL
ncbi:hypothetical protein D3C71_1825920 [compost metagenome]